MLTDLVEIHFLELPKFRALKDKNYQESALQRWLYFLQKDVSSDILKELMNMEPAIKTAEQKLDLLSSDPLTIELYKAREYSEHERANLISTGIEKGIQQGIRTSKLDIAKALLDVLDNETIALKTGLEIEEIEQLRENKI